MLDFRELSKDGTDLERLTREIFVNEGYEVHWTGKGADGGRDLIVIERVKGPLSDFERKWLVQCKHKAHSGQSIGKSEADSLITDSERIKATGYLMVCTTALSSGLIQAYKEISDNRELKIQYWDEVRLEDRLLKPCNFHLINQFFPRTSNDVGWKIYNTDTPSFWAAHYKNTFLYLSSRLNMHFKGLSTVESIYKIVGGVSEKFKVTIRLRAVYYDDKYTNYYAFVDVLVDKGKFKEERNPFKESEYDKFISEVEQELPYAVPIDIGYLSVQWDVKGYEVNKSHDGYDPLGKEFYSPYIQNFRLGYERN
jgi:hypothetical protein